MRQVLPTGLMPLDRLRESHHFYVTPESVVIGRYEQLARGTSYDWHGLARNADASYPFVLFQLTVLGWGMYSDATQSIRVDEGMGFCTLIPSGHRYFLPAESPGWGFLYCIISHPYIVSRIAERRKTTPAVLAAPADSALFHRVTRVLEIIRSSGSDPFSVEQALFDLLIEYERTAHASVYAEPNRERALERVRSHVLTGLRDRLNVDDLAAHMHMSRSHFAHHFKDVTGVSPAAYMLQLRVDEAMKRLSDPSLTLETIAEETGFASANHLCKVFRRRFRMSPGQLRMQVSGK